MEYRRMEFNGRHELSRLQELGNEGWELVDVTPAGHSLGMNYASYAATLRREPENHSAWELHIFNTAAVPQSWHDHIGSRGWTSVGTCIYLYYGVSLHVFKRRGIWAGSDDGDIIQRLRDMGWLGGNDTHTLKEILDLKWDRSQEEGRDIGTYQAVRLWLAQRYLRRLDDGIPIGREQQVLDELLALREAQGAGPSAPPLHQVINQWRALQR